MTWAERAQSDPSLRAFVDAEVARAFVELQAMRVEVAHQAEVIAGLQAQVAELSERKRLRGQKVESPTWGLHDEA